MKRTTDTIIALMIFVLESNCISLNGKNYIMSYTSGDNGVSRRMVYYEDVAFEPWLARIEYNKTFLKNGWDTIEIETNAGIGDEEQAILAGFLEGVETQAAIYDYFYNTILSSRGGVTDAKIQQYLDTNSLWINEMIDQYAKTDIYWRQIKLFYKQMEALALGYNSVASPDQKLTLNDIMWMNFNCDFTDLKSALTREATKALKKETHCSALIKLLPGHSDIFVAHNTWDDYKTMNRMIKRYTLPYKQVVATSMSFSGYPGTLVSLDDFFIINSGLVAQETTNNNKNPKLWSFVKATGQVLEAVRVAVSNRLADGGQSWTKIFSQYNSGTYNNQWMIVDMNKFTPGSVKPGLLWIAEQMPGYIRREDKTDVLTSQGYWASYNVPYFDDVLQIMGYKSDAHDIAPRAQIFKRDEGKVVDLQSMMMLMRSNDYKHDPLSHSNAVDAIAARGDLYQSGRPFGATDAKVTSYRLSQSLSMLAVSGPTNGTNLPPFQWSKSAFNLTQPHRGQPDLFLFEPILISWPEQQ